MIRSTHIILHTGLFSCFLTTILLAQESATPLGVDPDVLRAATEADIGTRLGRSRTDNLTLSTLNNFGITEDKLRDRKISVVTEGKVEQVTFDNAQALLDSGSLVVEKTGTAVTRIQDTSGLPHYTLPIKMQEIERSPSGELIESSFSPDIFPRSALEYYGDEKRYKSTVSLGVFEASPSGSKALNQPLGISLASLSLSPITPADLDFDTLNEYRDVDVYLDAYTSAPTLIVRPNFQPESFEIPVPMGPPPELLIDVETPGILGLGLEATTVNLQTRNIVNPDGLPVQLRVARGKLANNGVAVLDSDGRASLALRSTGLGNVRITSGDPLYASVIDGNIRYEFRWTFVMAVIFGGLVGSALSRRKNASWAPTLITGTLTGIVVVAAYAIGLNLLGITPVAVNGEALAFVLAALGAVAGPGLLSLKKHTVGGE